VTQLCREAGMSRSRFYALRARCLQYGEAGLRPKPRPRERPDPQVPITADLSGRNAGRKL